MRSLKIALLSLSFLFVFIGCKEKHIEPISYPSWYLNPPVADSSYLYGEGEGFDKKSALDAGLNAIASKLSVSVESSFENRKNIYRTDSTQSYSQEVTRSIKSSVEKITFNNYEINKIENIGGKLALLVRVDKNLLFKRKKAEFDSLNRVLKRSFQDLKREDPISRLKKFKNFNKKTQEGKNLAFLLNTLNTNFSIDKSLKTYEEYAEEEKRTKSQIRVYIQTDTRSKLLVEPIKVALNREGIQVISQKNSFQDLIVLKITSRDKRAKAMNFFVVKKSVNIELLNHKNTTVSSNKLTLVGKSTLDKKQSDESASRNFAKEISQRGILKILGLDS